MNVTKPNEQQIELIEKHKLNPENWLVISETKEKLIIKNRRGNRRTILKGE